MSAADGAEQFYTTANNAQRLEKADEEGLKIALRVGQEDCFCMEGASSSQGVSLIIIFNEMLPQSLFPQYRQHVYVSL